jgi:Flp pilus assembly protein TadG
MVEFAIVLPLLLMFILGILYFGRFEDYSNQATQLAAQGARMASVNAAIPTGYASLQAYLQSQAQPELASGSNDVTQARVYIYQPSSEGSVWSQGKQDRVCVTFTMTFPTPLATPSSTVAQTATMRLEQAPASATNPYSAGNGTIPAACSTS